MAKHTLTNEPADEIAFCLIVDLGRHLWLSQLTRQRESVPWGLRWR